ncbi:hypothetical protein K9N50_06550 [bacterium]|nr:hypothetical protein [bacterium]
MLTTPYYDRMIYHLVNEISKFIPWTIKEGEPGFPTTPIWQPRSGLGTLGYVKLTCDSENFITNVQAKDSLNKVVEIDFTLDKPNKKITLDFKYDGVIEGTMTEQIMSNGDMELTKKVAGVPTNDITILVKAPTGARPPHGGFEVEIDLGSSSYNGVITPYTDVMPTFVTDFITALDTKTPQTVTAKAARELLLPLGNWITAYDLGDKGEEEPPPMLPCAIVNIILVAIDNNTDGNSADTAIMCIALIWATGGNPVV